MSLTTEQLDFVKATYAKNMIDDLSLEEKENALYNSALETLNDYTEEDLVDEMRLSYSTQEIGNMFDFAVS